MAVVGLPEEVWYHVFEFLSPHDKLSVRSSCKLFKRVMDRPALWRNSTVYLEKITSYRSHFWRTLCKRKISSVMLLKAGGVKEWKELACRLPWLASLTIQLCRDPEALETLSSLKELRRLEIRQCCCPSLMASLKSLGKLTHISLCEVAPRTDIINGVSQLTNLTSLHYHERNKILPRASLHSILLRLPNLKHLSLKMEANQIPLPTDYFCPAEANHISGEPLCGALGLTSLELLNYMDPVLSPVALQGIPSLRSLTVQYSDWVKDSRPCHLKTWLLTLPLLSELSISMGFQLGDYANSMPGTVQNLSLKGVVAELKALREMAQQVPNLFCLHLDLCWHERSSFVAVVPQLFPKLQGLKIRHINVPEMEFLQLAQMSHLKRLVVLDPPSLSSISVLRDLIHKLNIQTNYRVYVNYSSQPKDHNACLCAYHL